MIRFSYGKLKTALILAIVALVCVFIRLLMVLSLPPTMRSIYYSILEIVLAILWIICIISNKKTVFQIILPIIYIGLVFFSPDLLTIAGAILGVIAVFNGFANKKLVYASTICLVLTIVISIVSVYLQYDNFDMPYEQHIMNRYVWSFGLRWLCLLLISVSIMIFGLNNTLGAERHYALPTAISGNSYASSDTDTSSVLSALEADYRSRKISSAEYSARRAEIIKKL